MQICANKHDPIVHDNKRCPLCSLTVHNDVVHDFIESKDDALVSELVAYQHKRNSEDLGNQQIQCGETPRQQAKGAIALLTKNNEWIKIRYMGRATRANLLKWLEKIAQQAPIG